MKPADRVPPLLQEAWVRQLRDHFEIYSRLYTGGRLRRPTIIIGTSRTRLGEWSGRDRTITISANHILEHRWESVLDTLRHEMAHQYVEEVLGLPGAPPHREAFAKACWALRVDPVAAASAGDLGSLEASREERDKMLQRIKELLAMAGSPNENEAANAMRLVQKYLLKYNLDLAQVERPRSFATRHIGRCSGRIQEYERTLGAILESHYFVETIWTWSYDALKDRTGRVLQISGTPENLEIAEYVYRYVMALTEPLWQAFREANGASGKARHQYLAGLLHGLEAKLDRHQSQLREEHGLVWRGDPLLKEYVRYLHPRLTSARSTGVSRGHEFRAGMEDGGQITIRRGLGGESQSRGHLLGDGR